MVESSMLYEIVEVRNYSFDTDKGWILLPWKPNVSIKLIIL